MARYLYSELSAAVEARLNCQHNIASNTCFHKRATADLGAYALGDPTLVIPTLLTCAQCLEWRDQHESTIKQLCDDFLPSGSGFDSGTKIDLDASHAEKLVFHTSFHHMNDGGFYDGWMEHTVTVTPSFRNGVNIRISGRNRNDIKEHIHEEFMYALCQEIEWDKEKECWRPFRETVEQMQERVEKGEIE